MPKVGHCIDFVGDIIKGHVRFSRNSKAVAVGLGLGEAAAVYKHTDIDTMWVLNPRDWVETMEALKAQGADVIAVGGNAVVSERRHEMNISKRLAVAAAHEAGVRIAFPVFRDRDLKNDATNV